MKLKPEDLVKVWDAPDNSRLTPKQVSIRLPIMVAAKISALCELYPRKTKTEIIGDLLATALDQLEEGLPRIDGDVIAVDPQGEPIYSDSGIKGQLRRLTEKYLRELEAEAGIAEPVQGPATSVSKKKSSK